MYIASNRKQDKIRYSNNLYYYNDDDYYCFQLGIDFGLNSDPMPVFRLTKKATTAKDAKSALLILLQHNCLNIIPRDKVPKREPAHVGAGYKSIDRDQSQYGNLYSLDIDMVINRLRYGRLLIWIKQKFTDVGVAIITELAFHGRKKYEDIVSTVVQIFFSNHELNATENDDDDGNDNSNRISNITKQIEIEVDNKFKEMIRKRYIVRVRSFGFQYDTGPQPEAPPDTYEGNVVNYFN